MRSVVTYLNKNEERLYISFGLQSNNTATWNGQFACYLNLVDDTIVRMTDCGIPASYGILYYTNLGLIRIATQKTIQASPWIIHGDIGSRIYLKSIDKWMTFKSNLPFLSTLNEINIVDINQNMAHIILNGVSYNMSLSLSTLGIFSTNEVIFIKGIIQCDKDVENLSGALILANTDIPANTEVKIIHDDTKVILLSDITVDGSWIKRAPYTLTGIQQDRVLWDGNVGTDNMGPFLSSINLVDSIHNYDKIGVNFDVVDINGDVIHLYREFTQYEITEVIDTYHDNASYKLSVCWGYTANSDIIEILSTSDKTRLDLSISMAHLKRITGINTKAPL